MYATVLYVYVCVLFFFVLCTVYKRRGARRYLLLGRVISGIYGLENRHRTIHLRAGMTDLRSSAD